jgi:hypothetical protein
MRSRLFCATAAECKARSRLLVRKRDSRVSSSFGELIFFERLVIALPPAPEAFRYKPFNRHDARANVFGRMAHVNIEPVIVPRLEASAVRGRKHGLRRIENVKAPLIRRSLFNPALVCTITRLIIALIDVSVFRPTSFLPIRQRLPPYWIVMGDSAGAR